MHPFNPAVRRLDFTAGKPSLNSPSPLTSRSFWLLSCLVFTVFPAGAQPSAPQQEIREALESWRDAFNARDANRVCDLFAPDLIAAFQGQPERNYTSLCALLRQSLRDPERSFNYALDIKEIAVSGDLAVVRLIWTLQIKARERADMHRGEERGIDIFRIQPDGRWRITRYLAYSTARQE